MRTALQARDEPWPGPVRAFECLPSTNDALKQWAAAGAPHGSVVLARQQTAGRGRQGHTWCSPLGNLYLSWLVRPPAQLALTLLPLAAGVALADALAEWGLVAQLKWPNDVLVGSEERKLAGVLTEATSSGGRVDAVVVGAGVNLAWDPRGDPELQVSATSLRLETGQTPELMDVAAALLHAWGVWYHALLRDEHSVVTAWRERAVPWWGQHVEVCGSTRVERGRLLRIDPDGALVLERAGTAHRLLSGEVSRLRRAE